MHPQEIVRLSNQFILKYVAPADAPHGDADPLLLLDYRCYMGEGAGGKRHDEMGVNYPPPVKQCLQKISSMTPQQVSLGVLCREL
jgi:hypothetical protein